MRHFFYLTFSIVFTLEVQSQSLLPGDLLIAGYNSKNPDQFSILTLKNLGAGEVFYITDCGWEQSTTSFRPGEGVITYTTPVAGIPAGTILTYPDDPGFVSAGVSGFFGLSTEGDQLYIFQNSFAHPDFIFAFNFNDSNWQTTAADNNSGTLPNTLNSSSSIALTEHDNAIINCTLLAIYPDPEDWKSIILQPSGWLLSDNRFLLPPDCNFISLGISPSSTHSPEEENDTGYIYYENGEWKWQGKNSGIQECRLLTMQGIVLYEISFPDSPEELNLSELFPESVRDGYYILQTRSQRSVKNFKIYHP